MGRGKLKLKRIENDVRRQATFSKRKAGLFKKAAELSLLCDTQISVIIFSQKGTLHEFGSPNVSRTLARYQRCYSSMKFIPQESQNIEELQLEVENLGNIITSLERTQKHMIGEDLNALSFKELHFIEKQIKVGATKIRSKKEKILEDYMESLKMEGRSLEEENANLRKQNKISDMRQLASEENGIQGPTTIMDSVEETGRDVHETNLTLSLSSMLHQTMAYAPFEDAQFKD